MIKREVFIGFFTGIFANLLGMLVYILLFSDLGLKDSISAAVKNDFLGTLILAGAILNFLPFFLFLQKKRIYCARGVLMASFLAAFCMVFLKMY